MKLIVRCFGATLLIILVSLQCWNIYQKDAVRENTERGLERSLEQAVQEVKVKQMYEYASIAEIQSDFVKSLSHTSSTAGDIKIQFVKSNNEQGLLDVIVTKTFRYPSGQTGEIIMRKCVITEEYPRS